MEERIDVTFLKKEKPIKELAAQKLAFF